jgi:SAM-dependent methyltransferase
MAHSSLRESRAQNVDGGCYAGYMVEEIVSPAPESSIEHLPTREGYDRWAAIYDAEDNPLVLLEEQHLAPLLGDVRGLDVVDLGCGTGRHAVRLAAAGARVTAVDFSDGMVAKARGKPGWDRVRFVAHDLTQTLPFAEQSFDRVLSCLVLDHIGDLAAFFSQCRRVCRGDGFVLVSVFHPAMMLRGIQARFIDPEAGRDVRPASHGNQVSDYVMGVLRSGLRLEHMSEHAVDDALAARSPRVAKYLGWPLLLLMRLRP